MKIDHIHFFVEDAIGKRNWFIQYLGWKSVRQATLPDRDLEILCYRDTYFVLSSPRTSDSPVAEYLHNHASGVVDVAFVVKDISVFLNRLNSIPKSIKNHPSYQTVGKLTFPSMELLPALSEIAHVTNQPQPDQWAYVSGWGGVNHLLIERRLPSEKTPEYSINAIDHIVLNVPKGELQDAVEFYEVFLGLQRQQNFKIQTEKSGLWSQVLYEPESQFYFNINEPTSVNSQIQDFLNINHGAGIQHIALNSQPIIKTVDTLRQKGLPLLSVPIAYYQNLQERIQDNEMFAHQIRDEWQQIVDLKILIDWNPDTPYSLLLQIFSMPIFSNSLFFFEFIERRRDIKGFGENNFLALYKAIEAESTQIT
jgi:4-hydroxyphenylpyruvate dioxygenase